jgi:HAD superfamily hydrolase (TIGR01509 family)
VDARSALLLDLGGVLVGVDPRLTYRALQRHASAAPAALAAAAELADRLKLRAFDLGKMTAAEFRVALCAAIAIELDQASFDRCWSAMITPLPEPRSLLAELAADHDLYLLSNTDPIHFAASDDLAPGWLSSLGGLHLSYEVGLAKPDPTYFAAALEAFGLDPARCLLLDDRLENLEGARAVGISGHLVAPGGLTRSLLVEWGLLNAPA